MICGQPKATQRFIQHAGLTPSLLGSTGLYVSQAGFGSYRVTAGSPEHKEALSLAISKGINLIDTSANYSDGESERLIGDVLHELFEEQVVKREELVIVSKAGYIQGKTLDFQRRRQKDLSGYKDVVSYSNDLEHCLHPDFLHDQLEQSLDRLQMPTIDVFLLHNPEYYKLFAQSKGIDIAEANNVYYQRIKKAFEFLETAVADGRIQYYGISSNTFVESDSSFSHTSLLDCLVQAESFSAEHHFKVIQMPLNLLETNAVCELNQQGHSTLQVAQKKQMGVLTNRPLNGIVENELFRLVDLEIEEDVSSLEVEDALHDLGLIESDLNSFMKEYLESIDLQDQSILFDCAALIQSIWVGQPTVFRWKELLDQFLVPRIEHQVSILEMVKTNENLYALIDRYLVTVNQTAKIINAYFTQIHNQKAQQLLYFINQNIENWQTVVGLTHKSLNALRQTEGVSAFLIGMRQSAYVANVIELLLKSNSCNDNSSWDSINSFSFSL